MEIGHSHDSPPLKTPVRVQRLLAATIGPLVLGTIVAAIVLWPPAEPSGIQAPASSQLERYSATVIEIEPTVCDLNLITEGQGCSVVRVRVDEGPDTGDIVFLPTAGPSDEELFTAGDAILINYSPEAPADQRYTFSDFQRGPPLLVLGAVFAAVVVALSRWKGLAALAGLLISLLILTRFVMAAILEGSNPVAVVVTGGAMIMFVTLYLAHGFNALTSTALLGTLISLLLTGLLAFLFVEFGNFTGLASEEALFLQISADQVNLKGVLLGGIIIGALGVLDDVTVTQASAVWELHMANPKMSLWDLYRSALRIGRDHIASTVNTLVLAYAGSSLPLLVLFAVSNQSVGQTLNGEVVAEEIVRTGVGSIGLVASVPVTTLLAAWVLTAKSDDTLKKEPSRRAERTSSKRSYQVPRAEQEWRT